MILAPDAIVLAPGVLVVREGLRDELRSEVVVLNESARLVVEAGSAERAAQALSKRFGVEPDQARIDALAFVRELNGRLLVNVALRRRVLTLSLRWIRGLPYALIGGALPPFVPRRARIETTSVARVVVTGVRATAPTALALGVFAAAFAALAVPAGPARASWALVLGACVAASVVVHELGHLVCLGGVPAGVVVRGLRPSVVHHAVPYWRAQLVAFSGPCAALAFAGVSAAAATAVPSAAATVGTAVFGLQSLGLTVLSLDGRRACGLS